jgi:hypothetical protein
MEQPDRRSSATTTNCCQCRNCDSLTVVDQGDRRDLKPHAENRHAEVARLRDLGATVLQEVKEPGTEHVVMSDPEGNEFCVQ